MIRELFAILMAAWLLAGCNTVAGVGSHVMRCGAGPRALPGEDLHQLPPLLVAEERRDQHRPGGMRLEGRVAGADAAARPPRGTGAARDEPAGVARLSH